jgi:hypothetical protein
MALQEIIIILISIEFIDGSNLFDQLSIIVLQLLNLVSLDNSQC